MTSIANAAKGLFKIVDEAVSNNPAMEQVTCTKGCAHCCYKLTLIGIPEGLIIAEEMSRDSLPALQKAAETVCEGRFDDQSYFELQTPCVFLSEDNTCGVYEVRPSCCRYHFSIDDPDMCRPDSDAENIRFINPDQMQQPLLKLGLEVADKMLDSPYIGFAPIPVVVLWCMAQLLEDESIITGTPFPEWQAKHLSQHKPWLDK
jgi:Fe-S-cluster containining protein